MKFIVLVIKNQKKKKKSHGIRERPSKEVIEI